MAYVYKHIRKDTNEVFYIGIGKTQKRMISNNARNNHWKNIVNKVGFEYKIIEDNLSWADACELEKQLIRGYGRYDLGLGPLVNMTDGGDGTNGIIYTKERNEKISKTLTGRVKSKLSKEHIQKIRNTALQNNIKGINTGLGKTDEAEANRVRKVIESQIGIPKPQSGRSGILHSQFGTCWITNETENKKIKKTEIIPNGWRLGRKTKWQ
jgi:hypothetical protein